LTASEGVNDICPVCGGVEWIMEIIDGLEYAVPCRCQAKARMNRRLRFADAPAAFKDLRLKTFSVSVYRTQESRETARLACKAVKYYLSCMEDMISQGMGLFLWSGTKGSGKTRMAAGIANELVDLGIQVKFATSLDILQEIKNTWSEDTVTESKLLDALSTVKVLVIDDFGTEAVKENDWRSEKFYKIINERYLNRYPTILTSNYSLEAIHYDTRITNRLRERTFEIHFPEESVREIIARSNQEGFIRGVFAEEQGKNKKAMKG